MQRLPKHHLIQQSNSPAVLPHAIKDGKSISAAWHFAPTPELEALMADSKVWYPMLCRAAKAATRVVHAADTKKWFGQTSYRFNLWDETQWNKMKTAMLDAEPALQPLFDQIETLDTGLSAAFGAPVRARELRIEAPFKFLDSSNSFHKDSSLLTAQRFNWNIAGIPTEGIAPRLPFLPGRRFGYGNRMLSWFGDDARGIRHRRRYNRKPRAFYACDLTVPR